MDTTNTPRQATPEEISVYVQQLQHAINVRNRTIDHMAKSVAQLTTEASDLELRLDAATQQIKELQKDKPPAPLAAVPEIVPPTT